MIELINRLLNHRAQRIAVNLLLYVNIPSLYCSILCCVIFVFIPTRANDNPHGAFRLRPNAQRITIDENLSRTLSFTVERIGGKFGEVKVSYSLEYSKENSKGYVTIGNDEIDVSFSSGYQFN